MATSHGQSILLGGFDGNQTQTAIAPATATSSSGVRQLTGPLQSAGAAGNVSARIWTDQTTNKELQWNNTAGATDGLWGSSTFTPASSTSTSKWVATQAAASWINYEITNTGTNDVVLDKFHISAKRLTTTAAPTGSPDTLTISLEQNGTFANPPVLSASALTATGTKTITLTTPTSTASSTASSSRFPRCCLITRFRRARKPLSELPTMRGPPSVFGQHRHLRNRRLRSGQPGGRRHLDSGRLAGGSARRWDFDFHHHRHPQGLRRRSGGQAKA